MSSEEVAVGVPVTFPPAQRDMDALQEDLERLNREIIEANEERAKAAEYGIVLLEEKQELQSQNEELTSLFDTTKRELETAVESIKRVQSDYEKRLKDVESQREQLLSEMESRESTLISKVDKQQEQIIQLERKLKQSVSEQEHLSDHNTILTTEIDKFRRECDVQKAEVKRLRQDSADGWRESEEKKEEVERLQKRVEKLRQYERSFPEMKEANRSLRQEIDLVHAQYESLMAEKAELEHQNSETMMALNEEREEKTQLEMKLREDELRSPTSPSWATERVLHPPTSPTGRNNLSHHNGSFSLSPTNSGKHSTPLKEQLRPSLLSELQNSLTSDSSQAELKSLRQKLSTAEVAVKELEKEKASLSERVALLAQQRSEWESESARTKEDLTKRLGDSTRTMESLKEDLLIKDEILDQLRNKLSGMAAERTSMEIEVDGMKNEVKRVQESSAAELERYRSDYQLEQERNIELRGQVTILEEQTTDMMEALQKLESIIFNSHNELASMTDDIHNMHKAVVSLVTDNKTPERSGSRINSGGEGGNGSRDVAVGRPTAAVATEAQSSDALAAIERCYTLQLKERKSTVQVHLETQSLMGISNLHDQLRSIRSPLEQFTKKMLERSLAHSTRHRAETKSSMEQRSSPSLTRRNTAEGDSTLNRWRSKLAVKTEEVNNLRAIMKARAATTEVSVSSLRSKLEGQGRAYQTELTKLKYQLRMLKKEKEEQYSQRMMYFKRCEDYSEEITRTKREIEGMRQDNTELLTSLKKTIQKKLDLSRELEEYKVEQERLRIIPARLGSSRV